MKGQWIGGFVGRYKGMAVANIDQVGSHYEGIIYMNPSVLTDPVLGVTFVTSNLNLSQIVTANIIPLSAVTRSSITWDEFNQIYGARFQLKPQYDLDIKAAGKKLTIKVLDGPKIISRLKLATTFTGSKSKITGQIKTWKEFKDYVTKKPGHFFRGQRKTWSLCTSFHRNGRFRLSEFIAKDVKQLHQRASAITSHFFDLNSPDQNGAFFNLLQHHGYPTPLLDWSYSPYVAAFFAFRNALIGKSKNECVRIYIFNHQKWRERFQQIQVLEPFFLHLSVMEFIAIDNPRLVPQQAVTTVTNVLDIEAYILQKEEETGLSMIEAIDIPISEREEAMEDLRFMGIAAGSMFPGLEGICEEFRGRNFPV